MAAMTEEGYAEIVRLYETLQSVARVAKVVPWNRETVRRVLHQAGVIRPVGVGIGQRSTGRSSPPTDRQRQWAVWYDEYRRCHCPSNAAYPDYGARGIQVHPDWRADLQESRGAAFGRWQAYVATLRKPKGWTEKWQIDRIDNDGHYWPGNLRWASTRTQGRNKDRKYDGMVPPPLGYKKALRQAIARRDSALPIAA